MIGISGIKNLFRKSLVRREQSICLSVIFETSAAPSIGPTFRPLAVVGFRANNPRNVIVFLSHKLPVKLPGIACIHGMYCDGMVSASLPRMVLSSLYTCTAGLLH